MSKIAECVAAEQCFAIEFEDSNVNRFMSLRFWKGTELCRVLVCRSELPSSELSGELGSLSRLLSAVSANCDVVACSGCPVDFVRTIDHSPLFSRAVQASFRFETLSLSRLMHKPSYSVFGHIDFFSVLHALVITLGGSLSEDWVLQSPTLSQVMTFRLW